MDWFFEQVFNSTLSDRDKYGITVNKKFLQYSPFYLNAKKYAKTSRKNTRFSMLEGTWNKLGLGYLGERNLLIAQHLFLTHVTLEINLVPHLLNYLIAYMPDEVVKFDTAEMLTEESVAVLNLYFLGEQGGTPMEFLIHYLDSCTTLEIIKRYASLPDHEAKTKAWLSAQRRKYDTTLQVI